MEIIDTHSDSSVPYYCDECKKQLGSNTYYIGGEKLCPFCHDKKYGIFGSSPVLQCPHCNKLIEICIKESGK